MESTVRPLALKTENDRLDAVRNGDSEAFAALYDRYHLLVYRIGATMLADAYGADDIVQSVFISVWNAPPVINTGSFTSWLTCVTRNRARDAMRSRNARRESSWPEYLTMPDTLDEHVHLRLEAIRIRRALEELPEAQRSLIELGFFGERSHAELAALTALPLGTVKTRIRAGLQKLRFALGSSFAADGIPAA